MRRALNSWPRAAWITIISVILLLLAYYPTTASTVAIWSRSETFAHGFLIFPISAYLIWRRRGFVAQYPPAPDWRGLILLALLGFGWLAADVANVLVVQQLALVAMISSLVLTLLGWRVVWSIAFPLGYLILAVPMGEFLIPHMQNFTADFTVHALQLTGIPVYREGTFFNIPSGNWSVVEGCSGLRYLIASFTLGTLYGYLTYRSLKKRILFAIASLIVPVIANGFRAYMIVMIAHLSDMRLALGVDHYIYGWVFFGIVMLLLFWIGSFWREDEETVDKAAIEPVVPSEASARRMMPVLLLVLVVAGFWPAYSAHLDTLAPKNFHIQLDLPRSHAGWQEVQPFADWHADYKGEDARVTKTYGKNGKLVAVTLIYYRYQREDAKLTTTGNMMIRQKHPEWSNVGESVRREDLNGTPGNVIQTKLRSPNMRLLIWHWNWLNGPITVNDYWAKLYEARSRLLGRWNPAAAIIIYAPYEGRDEAAADAMREFMRDMLPSVMESLGKAAK